MASEFKGNSLAICLLLKLRQIAIQFVSFDFGRFFPQAVFSFVISAINLFH